MIQAQDGWTLERCIHHAVENNLQVMLKENSKESVDLDVRNAMHQRYPTLSSGVNLGWNFGRTIDPTTNTFITETFFNNGISISSGVLLFNANRINNSIKLAKLNGEITDKELTQIKQDIALQVASAFLNIVFAQENLKNAQEQKSQTERQFQLVKSMIAVGNRPNNDILEVEAQLLQNDQSIVTSNNLLSSSKLALKQLLRLDEDFDIIIPENIALSTDPDILTDNEVYQLALQSQSRIHAAQLQINSAELNHRMSKASYYPSISGGGSLQTNYSNQGIEVVGFNEVISDQDIYINGTSVNVGFPQQIPILNQKKYFHQLTDNLSYGVGVNCQIPIYSNLNARTNAQKAKINIDNAKLNLELEENTLKTQVNTAMNDARAAKAKYASTQKVLDVQKRLLDNTNRKYEAGNSNTFELSNINSQFESAQINDLIAKYDYIFKVKVIEFYLGKPLTL